MNGLMIKSDTEEKRKHIDAILGDIYHDHPYDLDGDFNDVTQYERIYIDGEISYDMMADIVDYLRSCNPEEK